MMTEALKQTEKARPRRFRPYPEYKNSGVEWLGEIPAHWEVKRAAVFLRCDKRQIDVGSLGSEFVFHYSIPAIQESGDGVIESTSDIDSDKLEIPADRLLVSRLNPRKGVVAIACHREEPTVCSTEFVCLEATGCDLRWAYYLFLGESSRQRLSALVQSATRSHQRARPSDIVKLWQPLPPRSEQRAIAAFLDRETVRIDALVARKERLIELLQEKRTALITRAVTKGLDPTVPMKDSGVEWLGEIPMHWGMQRLKDLVLRLESGGTPESDNPRFWTDDCDGIPWVAISDMTRSYHVRETAKRLTEEGRRSRNLRVLPPGTLLYSMYASLGKVALLETDATINQAILGIVPRQNQLQRDYLRWWLEFMQAHVQMLSSSNTQDNLSADRVRKMPVVLPPNSDEQRAIAAFLDRETAKIDALVAKVREAIDRLKEFRTALISAAATGKIDVREEAR